MFLYDIERIRSRNLRVSQALNASRQNVPAGASLVGNLRVHLATRADRVAEPAEHSCGFQRLENPPK